MKRRDFLSGSVFAATAGLALEACGPDTNRLIPVLVPEESFVPGEETFAPSTCFGCASGCGLLVRKIDGRLVKVEGNPEHPSSHGGVCARGQALPQAMYHPDRLTGPRARGSGGGLEPIGWEDAIARVAERVSGASSIAFVTGDLTGHRAAMVRRFVAAFGEPGSGRHVVHEAFPVAAPSVDLATASYVVSLGVELLESPVTSVRFASQLAGLRQGRPGRRGKFVMVGPRLSLTAANADEWIPRTPDEVSGFAWELASVLLRDELGEIRRARGLEGFDDLSSRASSVEPSPEAERIARELVEHGPAAFVGPGASFLNALAGVPEIEVDPLPFVPWAALPDGREAAVELQTLPEALSGAPPDVVFVADTNPLYSAPSDRFQEWLAGAGFRVSVSSFLDETAAACNVILAESMSFERFEDSVPPGVGYPAASLQEPLLARTLYDTRSLPDALIAIGKAAGQEEAFSWGSYEAALREAWAGLDVSWSEALRQGGYWDLSGAGRRERPARLTDDEGEPATVPGGDEPILHVYHSTPFGDGRHAHLPYLQELSDPITGVRWGSVVEIASERAVALGIESGDLVELSGGAGTLRAEAFVTPGIHPDVVAVAAGQGHGAYGRYATGRGVNAFSLLDGGLTRVSLRKVTA